VWLTAAGVGTPEVQAALHEACDDAGISAAAARALLAVAGGTTDDSGVLSCVLCSHASEQSAFLTPAGQRTSQTGPAARTAARLGSERGFRRCVSAALARLLFTDAAAAGDSADMPPLENSALTALAVLGQPLPDALATDARLTEAVIEALTHEEEACSG
jgi:hypothetical protein